MTLTRIVGSLLLLAYLIYAEGAVYHHYLVVNRDYYPIMSEFYRMYIERFADFIGQMATLWLCTGAARYHQILASQQVATY